MFKDQSFNLDQNGISIILGCNKNAGEGSTNFVGKSRFFSAFPELITNEVLMGVKSDRTREGSTSLEFTIGKKTYEVTKTSGRSEKMSITCNGKDEEVHTLAEVKARVGELLQYTEEEVKTLLYLDSRLSHPLIQGTSAERQRFFNNFFRLNGVAEYRKFYKAELDRIELYKVRYDEVTKQAGALRKEVKIDLEDLKEKLPKLEKNKSLLEKQIDRLQEIEPLVSSLADFSSEKEEAVRHGVTSLEQCENLIEDYNRYIDKYTKACSAAKAYENYLEIVQEKTESFKKAIQRAKEDDAYADTQEEVESLLEEARTKLISAQKYIDEMYEYMESELETRKTITSTRNNLTKKIIHLERDLENAKEGRGVCPVCSGPFKDTEQEERISRLKKA